MRRSRIAVLVVCLMLAPVAQAGPLDGWAGWWADAWDALVSVFAADETTTEPEPEPVPPPKSEPPNTTSCTVCGGGDQDGEGRPSLDPDG